MPLEQIKASLDDPSFDRLTALRGHLAALEGERERLEGLIRSGEDYHPETGKGARS